MRISEFQAALEEVKARVGEFLRIERATSEGVTVDYLVIGNH